MIGPPGPVDSAEVTQLTRAIIQSMRPKHVVQASASSQPTSEWRDVFSVACPVCHAIPNAHCRQVGGVEAGRDLGSLQRHIDRTRAYLKGRLAETASPARTPHEQTLEQIALHPDCPREIYKLAADALGWARKFDAKENR